MGSGKGRRHEGGRGCLPTILGKASPTLWTGFDVVSWVPQGSAFLKAVQLLRGRAQAACSIPAESFFFPHRTSRLGPAEVPAAKTVHSEGRPCSAFPPGPAQADLVSASCSGGCSYSYRYLFKEPFWICQKGRYSNRKQARNIKGEVQMASTCTRKMCNLASNWWKVIEPEGIWWGGGRTVLCCLTI